MLDNEMVIVNPTAQQMMAPNGDETLLVKFYMESVKSEYLSEQEGRIVHVPKLFVSIINPGSNSLTTNRPAIDKDKERFPKQWMSYLNKQNTEVIGTRLEEWPTLDVNQRDELKAIKFYTVEQIAAASDQQLMNVPMGMALRTKAKAYLAHAKDSASAQKLAAEKERLEQDNAELKAQVKELARRLEAIEEGSSINNTPKRGRPRKVHA